MDRTIEQVAFIIKNSSDILDNEARDVLSERLIIIWRTNNIPFDAQAFKEACATEDWQNSKIGCQHLNYSDNLTGSTCNDCGIEV